MRTNSFFFGLVIAAAAIFFLGPTLVSKLQWAPWFTYLVIGLDGLLLADVPYQLSEYFASSRLSQRGYGDFAGGGGCFFVLLFGFAPVLLAGWLWLQYVCAGVC
jgi:hypothetical protein